MLAVRQPAAGAEREAVRFKWGLVPHWSRDPKIGVKHKGEQIADVPISYLLWMQRECQLDRWLAVAVERELNRREDAYRYPRTESRPPGGSASLVDLPGIITRWHREMVQRFHPDRGGSVEAMAALNEGATRLRELAGV